MRPTCPGITWPGMGSMLRVCIHGVASTQSQHIRASMQSKHIMASTNTTPNSGAAMPPAHLFGVTSTSTLPISARAILLAHLIRVTSTSALPHAC